MLLQHLSIINMLVAKNVMSVFWVPLFPEIQEQRVQPKFFVSFS